MKTGKFGIPGKKALFKGFGRQQSCGNGCHRNSYRTKKKQKKYYSVNKKHPSLKMQVVINQESKPIICLYFEPGHCHDFSLFKKSNLHFHPSTDSVQDSGYQGIKDYRFNSSIPKKKPTKANVFLLEKDYNRALAQEGIVIDYVNRSLKVFKILSSRYRNCHRRYGLRCNLLSALYNYDLALRSKIQKLEF
ncbi:transposase family protein [Microcoleus sp. Pol10D4]|uniref:transposase family protein n=1 Tax=Microcoleus sp. Pol10D4 TaxID=3055387 RepID=UPI002FD65C49